MTRLPIRLRVTAAFALAMATVLAGAGLLVYIRVGTHLSAALDRDLRLRAQDLTTLVHDPSGTLAGDTGTLVERGESYAQLLAPSGRVLDATATIGRRPVLDASELRAALRGPVYVDRRQVAGLDEPSRVLALPVERLGRPLVLAVGATRQDRAETLASLRNELLVAGPLALLLACAAGYVLAGASLRQVEAMRRRAAAISAERLGERLPVPATGDEVERLGATLNEMLDRLESALERERSFVADAGHELRTPLSLLRTELELALRHAETRDELREAVRRSAEEAERLGQLAEDLLLIARSDRGQLPLREEPLDAEELLRGVLSRFEWRAREAGRPLTADTPGHVALRGDRLRLEQALGNLVDNALRHGEGAVEVSARRANGAVELHVTDEGAGFAPEFLGVAFERFARADAARSRGGAGLGLAIVQAIAAAHDGVARARNRDSKGADVWLALPRKR
jgi:two-component system, OmpR family, sensor kinase